MQKRNANAQLHIIGMIPRPDVERELVTETNNLLVETFPECYYSPRAIGAHGHFLEDNVHLNDFGVYHAARLFNKIIKSLL